MRKVFERTSLFMRTLILSLFLGMTVLCGCETGKVCDARGEIENCELHHRVMHSEKYPNPHLKTPPSQEYLNVRVRYFVHSKPTLYGLPDECKYCMVFICDDCVQAEQQWKAAQH